MRERIVDVLRGMEKKWGIHILYACEYQCRKQTGPYSTYQHHVRFIFARPLDKHLCVVTLPDQYFQEIDNKVEVYGLDLKRALLAVWISDSSIFEWLSSREIYLENTYFSKALKAAMPIYFSPRICMNHYFMLASKIHQHAFCGNLAPIGSIYAVIYTLLLFNWIRKYGALPPYDITQLETQLSNAATHSALHNLLMERKNHPEGDLVICAEPIVQWVEEQLKEYRIKSGKPKRVKDPGALDLLYQYTLSHLGTNPLLRLHLN
jgi:predicted nucleotidyltransferase